MDQQLPLLETPRLILRQLGQDDLEFVYNHFSNPSVYQYLLDESPLTSMEQAQQIIDFYTDPQGKNNQRWVIVRKSDQVPVGTCGFHKWDQRNLRAEVGYDLEKESWGQGIMLEALKELIHFGFSPMGLNRIEALVYTENTASLRLLKKLGFHQEGLLREYFCQDDRFYDHWLYALLRRDWVT